ncbi:hypothetical protein IMCC9480_680 [Oxalobacteraceae bacterium IMCC9480]|nr:hypothetical protein IMCC9480_680 [Oxalobacteraceae bacterium IMCC9480]
MDQNSSQPAFVSPAGTLPGFPDVIFFTATGLAILLAGAAGRDIA